MSPSTAKLPRAVTVWLLVCVYLNCLGWVLSAVSQLNFAGYAAGLLLGAALSYGFRRRLFPEGPAGGARKRNWGKRFRRPFAAAFLVLAGLALLGGALHPPTNYDGLAYRVPRILYWFQAGHWEWIHTNFHRLNTRSCGWEWVAAPLLLFTRTDRLLFLINGFSFLLLPGLFFSLLTRLGVSRRAAWYWMWLLPSGYCYTLQAASIANDLFSGMLALMALDFGLRARANRSLPDLWCSILAAAMMTGAKSSTIPLGLPWLVVVLPVIGLLFRRLTMTLLVGGAALLASFLPMAALNIKNCGDWTGNAAEHLVIGNGDAMLHIGHNIFVLFTENLVPPVFPLASTWNHLMVRLIPPGLAAAMAKSFETGAAELRLPEMQIEENAGIGCGLMLLLGASWLAGRRARSPAVGKPRQFVLLHLGTLVAVFPFLIKGAFATTARLFNPYYGYLAPILLGGSAQGTVVRRNWWRWSAYGVFALSAMVLIISPARPLWPVQTVLSRVGADRQGHLWQRARTVYSVYAHRPDAFAAALEALPTDAGLVGLVTWDDPEFALWKPLGGRRFRHVLPADSLAVLKSAGVQYVLVSQDKFSLVFPGTVAEWLTRMDARVLRKIPLTLRAEVGGVEWLLVEIGFGPPEPAPAPKAR